PLGWTPNKAFASIPVCGRGTFRPAPPARVFTTTKWLQSPVGSAKARGRDI
ncbi:hypothetical protein J6590_010697, partial [Homalodisca vitripennis]